jgi:hypothetical protein
MTDIVERLREWRMHASHKLHADLGTAADEIESLRQQLAECQAKAEHWEATCHGQWENYQQLFAECQAREREKTEALRIVQAAICLAADDAPESTIGKLYDHVSKVVVMPYDSTALDQAIQQALRPVYDFVGRDYAHIEPKEALEAWLSDVIRQAKREALLEAANVVGSQKYDTLLDMINELRRMAKELET